MENCDTKSSNTSTSFGPLAINQLSEVTNFNNVVTCQAVQNFPIGVYEKITAVKHIIILVLGCRYRNLS